jgi:hypothetical protein
LKIYLKLRNKKLKIQTNCKFHYFSLFKWKKQSRNISTMADEGKLTGDADLRKKLQKAFFEVIRADNVTYFNGSPLYIIHADDDYYVLANVCAAADLQLYPGALAVFPGNYVDEKIFLAEARSLNGTKYTDVGEEGLCMVTYEFAISDTTVETVDQPKTPTDGLQAFLDNRRDEQHKQRQPHANVKFILQVTPTYLGFTALPIARQYQSFSALMVAGEAPVAEQKQTVVAELHEKVASQTTQLAKLQETQAAQLAQLATLEQELLDLKKPIAQIAEQLEEAA